MSDVCSICREEDDANQLTSYCQCKGSVALVHFYCLKRWIETSGRLRCNVCLHKYKGIKTICRPKTLLSFMARHPFGYSLVALLFIAFYALSFGLFLYSTKFVDHFLAIGISLGNTFGFSYSVVYIGYKDFIEWKKSEINNNIEVIRETQ